MNAKRILMCAAALSCALLFQATASAAVESPIVGYTTIEMEAGKWYQIGRPFVELEEGSSPKLNTVLTSGFADGDVCNVFDPASVSYVPYYWKSAANGWCSKRGTTPVDVDLPASQAVFINKAVTATVSLAGRVSTTEISSFGTEAGGAWDQIICVYPSAVKLNEMKWSGLADGDICNVLNSETTTYEPYYWKSAANGWCSKRGTTPVDVEIYAGQALFINKKSAGVGTCSVN